MSSDPVVAEIRAIREAIAAKFDYNIRRIGDDARRRDAEDDRPVISLSPGRPTPILANGSEEGVVPEASN